MYTGTLIDDLMGMVERAQTSLQPELEQAASLAFLCAMPASELPNINPDSQLAGVA